MSSIQRAQAPVQIAPTTEGRRQRLLCVSAKDASRYLRANHGISCTAEWLRNLPIDDSPRYFSGKGKRYYVRRDLDDWANKKALDLGKRLFPLPFENC